MRALKSKETIHTCLPIMHKIGHVFEEYRETFNAVWADV